jgi:hypothetical protein
LTAGNVSFRVSFSFRALPESARGSRQTISIGFLSPISALS